MTNRSTATRSQTESVSPNTPIDRNSPHESFLAANPTVSLRKF
jgi:hypothetical protein